MLENSIFNDEWNALQKSFWEKVDSKLNENSDLHSNINNTLALQLPFLFEQWLIDVDKCWQDHAQDTSGDIDSLYKKLSSASRFFFNSSGYIATQKEGKTADVFVSECFENISKMFEEVADDQSKKNTSGSNDKKNLNYDVDAFLKLPLENWQRHVALLVSEFANPRQSASVVSQKIEYDTNNPELSAALGVYLSALKEYLSLFFNVFTITAKDLLDVSRSNGDEPTLTARIMITWLEMLDENHKELILSTEYSEAYANVINSWMLVLTKSNQSFSEFMQPASSGQSKSNGQ